MKISMSADVLATFSLTFRQITYLKDCSSRHYDHNCRLVGKPGGFLFGWNNNFWPFGGPDDRTEEVVVNQRQLDTLFKLIEFDDNEIDKIPLYKSFIKLRVAIHKYSIQWKEELDLE